MPWAGGGGEASAEAHCGAAPCAALRRLSACAHGVMLPELQVHWLGIVLPFGTRWICLVLLETALDM